MPEDIIYYKLGRDKKLNEIVMAGSHDAGITGGGKNTKTQGLKFGEQARAGVRVFDLRVAAATVPYPKAYTKEYSKHGLLRTVHEPQGPLAPLFIKREQKTRQMDDSGKLQEITRTKLSGGDFGQGLGSILLQAKSFVQDPQYKSEFLILKFDKSTNWELIADLCVRYLGDRIYTEAGNLNTKTLRELKGQVIVVFSDGGLKAVRSKYTAQDGILGWKNLQAGGSYEDRYDWLQYYGKGGTNPFSAFGKIKENLKKQSKLMSKGAKCDPEVMGMMYWTTTGIFESIQERNSKMWSKGNRWKLQKLWAGGRQAGVNALDQAVEDAIDRIPDNVDSTSNSSGSVLKAFMPNIVMIDFASPYKCKKIYELNGAAPTILTKIAQEQKERYERLVENLTEAGFL